VTICLLFVSSRQQLSAPLSTPVAICSQLQLVRGLFRNGAVYFRVMCISICHPCEIRSAGKFRRKFRDERVPSRQTIHNLLNKLRETRLLIDKKQKHKRRVLTEKKLDDIGTRLEHTPRKSLKRLAQETGVSKSSAVFVHSNTGIVGPNPTQGMDVCMRLFCVCAVLCVGSGLATG
jgi:hypothetical protein